MSNANIIGNDAINLMNSTIIRIGQLLMDGSSNINNTTRLKQYFLDNIIPFFSIIIARLAFFVGWRALYVIRKHNILSLKPYLIFRADTNYRKGKVRLYISNKGLGPCIFDEYKIKNDGNTFNIY